MLVALGKQQHAAVAHKLDYLRVCLEHTHTGEMFYLGGEVSGVIYRAIDFQPVALADYEIVVTVTRCRMHHAGARLARRFFVTRFAYVQFGLRICLAAQRDVFAHHQKRRAIDPGMATLKPIQFRAHETRKHFRFDPVPGFILWLFISNMIQIFLMPLIMVGQNLDARHSEARAEADFEVNLKAEREVETILMHLENQNQLILHILERLDQQDQQDQQAEPSAPGEKGAKSAKLMRSEYR